MKKILLVWACLPFALTNAQTPVSLISEDSVLFHADSTKKLGTDAHAPDLEWRNGSGTLGQIYNNKECGLNFAEANVKVGKRFTPAGVNQPAPLNIAGIPASAVIEQAYLWAVGSGNGAAQTATIVNPGGTTQNFPMTIVGSGPDKCWGYSGAHTYRADITSIINGNGTYNVSGILTNPPTSGNDMDGIAMIVIYSDPCATYEGHMILHDGMVVINGGATTQNITGINACANSTAAQSFMYVADLQMGGATVSMNGTPATYTWNWWNYFNVNTSITAGQATSAYSVNSGGDCYGFGLMGLYYQTTGCTTCGPATSGTMTDPVDVNMCAAGGTASFSTTATGSVLGYQWYVNTGSGFTALTNTAPYSGVNTATLTVSPVTAAMSGYQYQCVVDFCGPDATTAPATLTVAAPPTAVCQDITLNLSATGLVFMNAEDIDGGSTVSCGTPILTASATAFNCAHVGPNNVTLSVMDGMGNTSTCTAVVTVVDVTDPDITCPPNTTTSVDFGTCTTSSVFVGSAFASDICDISPIITNDAPASYPAGVTTITWTATDASGNTATCAQTVTVNDIYQPSITCPTGIGVVNDPGLCSALVPSLGTPVTSDNCGVASVTNDAPSTTYPVGNTTVTWTVTDNFGNINQCIQSVMVIDLENPTITCPSNINVNTDAGSCSATGVTLGTPVTADNCAVASVTNNAPAVFPLGTTTVTWTVTDNNGRTATCTQTVTVTDNESPIIVCPANVSVSMDAGTCSATGVSLGTPTTSDNCSVASATSDAPSSFALGTTTVTWTVTDGSGNTATCTQTVTVTDNENPSIVCPASVSVSTDPGSCTATGVALGTPITSDNCSVASVTNDAPVSFPVGTTTVTWTVTDGSGNTATCTQTVTITDTEDPIIACPGVLNMNTDASSCTATSVLTTPPTSDNCTVAGVTNDAPASFPLGSTTVTWTVADVAGNTATCTQIVMVSDNENPSIVCPTDVNVNVDAGSCLATSITLGAPVTSDNCSVASVTNDAPASFPVGITTVTWTVTDGAGNTATCTQTVTVTDNENPAIVCPSDVSSSPDAGSCVATGLVLGTPVTSDNCTVASVVNDAPAVFPGGPTAVTWTVADASGNTAACIQTITVTDIEAPVMTCAAGVSVNTDAGICSASGISLGTPVTSDNCAVTSITNDAPSSFPVGTTTVTWTAADNSGNTSTCTQLVTVTDNENPAIVCPGPVSVSADAGSCMATGVSLGTPVTSDNCTVAGTGNDAPVIFPLGTTVVTWTVTDGAGNTTTCAQSVTVTDSELPVIVCPGPVSVSADAGSCMATGVSLGTPVTSDNCSVASVTNDAPASFPVGATTVTWTVTDGAGNMSTCTQTVTVTDNENPVIACPAGIIANTDAGSCMAAGIVPGTPVTSDNCTVTSVTNDAPASYPVGITTVTWTVTDGAGNTAACAQTVTITDIQPPVAVCQDITVNLTTAGTITVAANAIDNGSSDNCAVASLTLSPSTFTCANIGANPVTLTVTDNSGNTSTCSAVVTVAGTPLAITAPAITAVDCSGNTTGGIQVTVTGGNAPLVFDWSHDGTGDTDDNEDLTGVAAGTYTLVVTDATSCTASQSFTITEPAPLNITFTSADASCFGSSDGSASASVTGGTAPYLYSWSSGHTTPVASALPAGTYTLTVTDDAGCTFGSGVTINEPAQVVAAITGPSVMCLGQTIVLTAGGGTSYVWSTGETSSTISVSPSVSTTYSVTAIVGLCTGTTTYSVTVNGPPDASITGDSILCPGETTVLTADGGDTYIWSEGSTSQTATMDNSDAGIVYVVAQNSCGNDTVFITLVNDSLTGVDAGEDQTIMVGQSVTLSASGGGAGGYTWSPADELSCTTCASPVATPLATTTYTVISQNENGCTDSDEVTITVDVTASVLLPDIFSPNGNGVNDVLLVRGTGIHGMVFRVYDRWGQKVFESTEQSVGWDGTFQGKPLDTGVFVYTLTGTFYTGETFERKGNITLKR